MDVYLRRQPGRASGWSPLTQPSSDTPRTNTLRFPRPPVSNIHELGDIHLPCSPPCPPSGTRLEMLRGGRQLVPRRVQVACTIVSMGQASADACGLTRTCTVVANCHHRATCGFAPTRRAATTGWSPAAGLIRTAAVVPIWHHRVTWASTRNGRRALPAPTLENKTDNYGSANLAGPYDLGKRSGAERRYHRVLALM